MEAFKERLGKWETNYSRLKGMAFRPRATDVFVTTSPKCGTTWLQQITHQLRVGGDDTEFPEITAVVPWIEAAGDLGMDLDAQQQGGSPRCFKTHLYHDHVPKGAKYICVFRDPQKVGPSFYHFMNGWLFPRGDISMDKFIVDFWMARGKPVDSMDNASYWDFLLSYWPLRHDDHVLFLFYEDLVADLRLSITVIAEFMGIDVTSNTALLDRVLEKSSLEYMQAHSNLFDDNLVKVARNKAMGLDRNAGMDGDNAKVRNAARVEDTLSPKVVQAINDRWERQVFPVTGHRTYEDLRQAESRVLLRQRMPTTGTEMANV